jgi:arylsulfatase A-like enzyme
VTAKRRAFLWLILILLLAACQKEKRSDFRLYRFIDELRSEGILRSPFMEAGAPGRTEPSSPAKSSPLTDLGSGENPYNLKKKLRLEGVEITVLFAPAPSAFRFEPDFASAETIEFGVGVAPDGDPQSPPAQDPAEAGVEFRVSLEKEGRREILFQEKAGLPPPGGDLFSMRSVKTGPLGKDTHIILETDGNPGLSAFWYNPILYTRARKTRAVVLVSVDTLRADHLGCYGYERETSPAVDALAEESALFFNTYAPSPWTLPSHVSLLTSLNGVRHQVYYEDDRMNPDQVTLAEVLRSKGYMTTAFTDGGFLSRVYGFGKGFDAYYERSGGVLSQDSAMRIWRPAAEWLDNNKDKDFFLFLHTYQPHDPYACPRPYATMFLGENPTRTSINLMGSLGGYAGRFRELPENERQEIIGLYDGEVRYTDEALVAPLIAKLKELGLYDSALIIFTSDHGEEFFDHHGWSHGHNLYDEALRVPLIIKFPGGRFKGRRLEPIVRLLDIMPTICEETSIDPDRLAIDGKSLFPILRGKERGDRTFLADVGDNIVKSHVGRKIALNSGQSKLILNRPFTPEYLAFFISPPPMPPAVELFDLARDPGEKRNLADEEPAVARELNSRVVEIYKRTGVRKAAKIELDEALKERLRALGYIR